MWLNSNTALYVFCHCKLARKSFIQSYILHVVPNDEFVDEILKAYHLNESYYRTIVYLEIFVFSMFLSGKRTRIVIKIGTVFRYESFLHLGD